MGDDHYLYLWDYLSKELILFKHNSFKPTFCKFSQDGTYLALGYVNGNLIVYKLKISKSTNEKTYEIDLSQYTIYNKDVKQAVLSIEFSHDDGRGETKMAVSYDNIQFNHEEPDVTKVKEQAFVNVFFVHPNKPEQEIRIPSTYKTEGKSSEVYGIAVYFMSFSEDNNYLMLYYQFFNNNHVRVNKDK